MNLKLALRATVVAALLALACSLTVQAQSGRNNIRGAVTQAGKPLRSVFVIVRQGGVEKGRGLTGDDGKYYISYLDAATYDVVVLSGKKELYTGKATLPKNATFDIKL